MVSGDRNIKDLYGQCISKQKHSQGMERQRATGLCRLVCRSVNRNMKHQRNSGGKSQGPSQNKFWEMEKALKEKAFGLGNCEQRQSLPV